MMASPTAGDVLIETLMDWGVDTIFGIPGDGINGIIESLRTRQDKIRFIQVRHEEAAAFAACAYAKWTGRLGVCLATSGPGGIHLLNGLYDAKLDGQPVLAITGLQFHDLIETFTQQDVELDKLYMESASTTRASWGRRMSRTSSNSPAARRWPIAASRMSPCPSIFSRADRIRRPLRRATSPGHISRSNGASRAAAERRADLRRAADILNAGKKIAILAGRGALRRPRNAGMAETARRADRQAAARQGAAFPTTAPIRTGGIGLLGTGRRRTRWKAATRF